MLDLIVRHSIDLYNPCFVWHCWSTVPVLLNTVDAYTAHIFLNIDLTVAWHLWHTAYVLRDIVDLQPMFRFTRLAYRSCFVWQCWPRPCHVIAWHCWPTQPMFCFTLLTSCVYHVFAWHCWPLNQCFVWLRAIFSDDGVEITISVVVDGEESILELIDLPYNGVCIGRHHITTAAAAAAAAHVHACNSLASVNYIYTVICTCAWATERIYIML